MDNNDLKEEIKAELRNEMKKENKVSIPIMILCLLVGFGIGFGVVFFTGNKEDKEKDNDKEVVEEQPGTTDEEKEPVEEEKEIIPTDDELITRSKTLYTNVYKLLRKEVGFQGDSNKGNGYTVDGIDFVGKITKGADLLVNLINETFVDFETAINYVPYYEKNGTYYYTLGDLGGGAGYRIYEYYVENKTATTATIRIDNVDCYDVENGKATTQVDKINACTEKSPIFTERLYLKNINGKWLVEKFESTSALSLK